MKKIIIFILIIFLTFLIIFLTKDNSKQPNVVLNNENTQNNDYNNTNNENTQGEINNNINKDANDKTTIINENCEAQQISYGIKNFKKEVNNNIINCSLETRNLDSEISGEFKIKIILLKDNQEIDSEIITKTISPQSKEIFSKTFEFKEDYSCIYKTMGIPKKIICKD